MLSTHKLAQVREASCHLRIPNVGEFFIAAAGASGALAGLVFVALSVNIADIIRHPHLPARAAATIASLILILVSSMAVLIPQRALFLGIEVFLFGAYTWWLQVVSARNGFQARAYSKRPAWEARLNAALGQAQTLPFIAGAVFLIAGDQCGMYWLAVGSISVFVFSTLNSWCC
ncbi:MAG TPA: hypothetical protein VMU43_00335 [Candidatus Acidoferrum sp.]|nr:hypothetical protein [Candidatus Acidoferrum sp.]